MTTITSQVRALQDLTPAQLAARYQELPDGCRAA